jgi:integrase
MTGVVRDRYGLRAYVKYNGLQVEKRFPFGTDPEIIREWREKARRTLKLRSPKATKDTLRADARRYLEHKKRELVTSGYRSLVCEINAWLPAFGTVARPQIQRTDVLEQRQRWLADGYAPKTCNHRVRALRALYHYLDGSRADTPCDDIPKLKEPPGDPKFVSPAKLRSVAKRIVHAKTRARFMVLAATGQRPAQLKRAESADVDLRRRVWFVRPAKGGNPIPIILTADMIAAWKAFKAADAWGYFDGSDYAKQLYAAGWPKGIRPYNTKHTVAITLGESDADWEDIKDWFGQKDVKTTRIYTGVVLKRYRNTSAKLAGRLGWQ